MDGRKVSPALRLVKDALCRYQSSSTPQPAQGRHFSHVDRERLARARRILHPAPELSQADPLPMKESARATSSRSTSAGPSTCTPLTRLVTPPSRPTTSGPAIPAEWQALPRRPGTSPASPQASPKRPSFGMGPHRSRQKQFARANLRCESYSSQCSTDSLSNLQRQGHPSLPPKKIALRMAFLAGRLHQKVFKIRASTAGECDLARSCRKRYFQTRVQRNKEKNIAAAAIHSRQLEEWGSPTSSMTATAARRRGKETAKSDEALNQTFIEEKPKEEAPSDESNLNFTSFKAHELSCDYNLPGGHVTQAWKLFKRYDADNDDLLSPYEFQLLLRAVLRDRFPSAKDVPRELFKEAIDIQDTELTVTFADFLTWISRHAFQECLLLTDEQRFMRLVARKFHIAVTDIEDVKRHFDSFAKTAGQIEYPEFYKLLALLLNLQDVSALPETRVKSFWRELDESCSGVVEFSEFIPWYLGYFGGDDGAPLVNFYRKIRPIPIMEDCT